MGTCSPLLAACCERILHPIDIFAGSQETIDGDKRIGHFMAEQITGRSDGLGLAADCGSRALERFGAQGVIDLIGTNGYYTFLAMQLNANRLPLPEGAQGLPKL